MIKKNKNKYKKKDSQMIQKNNKDKMNLMVLQCQTIFLKAKEEHKPIKY